MGLYEALAAAAFGACVAVMGLAYLGILAPGLRQPEVDARRRALTRWIGTVAAFQLMLGAAIIVYLAVAARTHAPALGRALPPLGAVAGNALTLQLAVFRLARALRG